MRILATFLAIALTANASVSHAEFRHKSSRLFGGPANEAMSLNDFPYWGSRLLAADAAGGVFILASGGPVSFGGEPVGPGTLMARLDPSGAEVWSRKLIVASSGTIVVRSIAATDDGGVVFTGSVRGTVDFGAGLLASEEGSDDMFVVKLDPAGAVAWQHLYGDFRDQQGRSVTVANGDVVVTGSNSGVINFGVGDIVNRGASDAFVVRLDGDGGYVWAAGFGQTRSQDGIAVEGAPDGGFALACRMNEGAIDIGGNFIWAVGLEDIVLAVFDSTNTPRWSKLVASQLNEFMRGMALDPSGNLTMCGAFQRRLDLGGEVLVAEPAAVVTGFVVSYDSTAAYRWSYQLNDSLQSTALGIATDRMGRSYVTASRRNAFNFAGEQFPADNGLILFAFESLGAPACALRFGDPSQQNAMNVSIAVAGDEVALAGANNQPIDFGGGLLDPDGYDLYFARLEIRQPPEITIAFDGRAVLEGVELRWTVASNEPLVKHFLTRRTGTSSEALVLSSGPALDGETVFVDENPRGGLNTYQLTVETDEGDPVSSQHVLVNIPVPATSGTKLEQNAPNPFNPVTAFGYTLATEAAVSIVIYDHSGALVARLDQGVQPAGRHVAKWGGHNAHGESVASGVYFYRLEGAGDVGARKMILLK